MPYNQTKSNQAQYIGSYWARQPIEEARLINQPVASSPST